MQCWTEGCATCLGPADSTPAKAAWDVGAGMIQSSRSVKSDGCTDTWWLRKIGITTHLDKKELQAAPSLGRAGVTRPGKQYRAQGMLLAKQYHVTGLHDYNMTHILVWNFLSSFPSLSTFLSPTILPQKDSFWEKGVRKCLDNYFREKAVCVFVTLIFLLFATLTKVKVLV